MLSFFLCLAILIAGYFWYGAYVEKSCQPLIDDRKTPAYKHEDDIDYVPMDTSRVFLIQLLNIAGLGPIFGALSGALWGPVVFLWITLGTLLAGGVHDYYSGIISERNNGVSISEVIGKYLGRRPRYAARALSILLLLLSGVTFTTVAAGMLTKISPLWMNYNFWLIVLLLYYFLATFVPIDKVIGRLYPFFGVCLFFMAVGVGVMLFVKGYHVPEITLKNLHPEHAQLWPMLFVTVSCGAISGFHATQSPLMARCLETERDAGKIFFGAMVCEGVITLIWAAVGCAFYRDTVGLSQAMVALQGTDNVVYDICHGLMGPRGALVALLGIIACPITSADTSLRSLRYTISDWFQLQQDSVNNRLMLSLPIVLLVGALTQLGVTPVWQYFSWLTQVLAMLVLWAASIYLFANKGNYWVTVIPATFMSMVCGTYILVDKIGLQIPAALAYPLGIAFAILCFWFFDKRTDAIVRGKLKLEDALVKEESLEK